MKRSAFRVAARTLITAFLALVVGFAWSATPFAQALAGAAIAMAFIHASLAYGVRHALALLATCLLVTIAIENVGVATGFPFGRYNFEVGAGLPRIGAIPLIVGPLWFGMGYMSWIVAIILIGGADERSDKENDRCALPLVAAIVMTQWDLVMDAPSSTIAKAWIWHDGGADFGVPLSNYFGWLLTSWLFFQLWAFYLSRQPEGLARLRVRSREFGMLAILLYLSAGVTHVTPWLLGSNGAVADGAGHLWLISDLRERTVVVMLLTMAFTSILATLRLMRRPGVSCGTR